MLCSLTFLTCTSVVWSAYDGYNCKPSDATPAPKAAAGLAENSKQRARIHMSEVVLADMVIVLGR